MSSRSGLRAWLLRCGQVTGKRWRSVPVVRQAEVAECGLACLAMIAAYHGSSVDLRTMRSRFPGAYKGLSLGQLVQYATEMGLKGRPLRVELQHLGQLHSPCILHWDFNHFVVMVSIKGRRIVIHDPALGRRSLSLAQVSSHFTGVAVEFAALPTFQRRRSTEDRSLRSILKNVRETAGRSLVQVAVLAIALEACALMSPFFMQWVIDRALGPGKVNLLWILGPAFLALALSHALVTALRSWATSNLAARLTVQWTDVLVSHMLRLPYEWFERRHVSDVLSRLGSIRPLKTVVAGDFVSALLDGALSLVTFSILFYYSVLLGLLVVAMFAIYLVIRWLLVTKESLHTAERLACEARLEGDLLESIRSMMAIKLANQQQMRRARHSGLTAECANRELVIQRLGIYGNLANGLLFGAGRVVLVWLAAILVAENKLSTGMFIAFIAYADQFLRRSSAFVSRLGEMRLLRLHLERLSDISGSAVENLEPPASPVMPNDFSIEIRNVGFRYAESSPWILRGCNLKIRAGEAVAITGPSGCGKTTLAKLVLGLLQPTEGEVLLGGVAIRDIGYARYREIVSAVMQDDHLVSGTLSDNICFGSDKDTSLIERVARQADIHADIELLPMGYRTFAGEMGSTLSGGQRQRVMLARALYRQPAVLVLDEATSHLDSQCERRVCEAVSDLRITRFIIAHRLETINCCDRVIDLGLARESARSSCETHSSGVAVVR